MRLTRPALLLPALAVLAGSAVLSGCDSSGEKPQPAAGPSYTVEDARAALLVASDLPRTYTRNPGYQHDQLPGGCAAVEAAVRAESDRHPTYVVQSFTRDEAGASIDQEIAVFGSAADAAAQLDADVEAFKSCPSWQVPSGATLSITPSQVTGLGDNATSLRIRGSVGGEVFGGSQLVVQSGNALVSVSESGPGGDDDDPTVDLKVLTLKLLQRLRAQAGG